MSKKLHVVVALLAVVAVVAACSKAAGGISKEEVAKVLPNVVCSKMVECAPAGGPSKDECVTAISKQVVEGKNGQPFPTITKAQLDACVAGFGKITCQDMQTSANPPQGCEFLAKK